ncbi:MAG: A24 family peptidase [Bacillota bacterium]|nr:A24 family peptidase [Bacillota bacterium]
MTIIYVKLIVGAALGSLAGLSAVYIFNRMPASWLCEYGEEPSEGLKNRSVQRVKGWPWRWVYCGLFACLSLRMLFAQVQRPLAGFTGLPEPTVQLISQGQIALASLFACWAMLIIGLADLKYMIIPDQFVIMLAISSLGVLPLYGSIGQPLGGLVLGGGTMLAVALLGRLTFHKDVMGFGDVKLCAAMGLCLGLRCMLIALAAGCLASGIGAAIGLARRKYRRDEMKPLGPYLCGAGIFTVFIVWPFIV